MKYFKCSIAIHKILLDIYYDVVNIEDLMKP